MYDIDHKIDFSILSPLHYNYRSVMKRKKLIKGVGVVLLSSLMSLNSITSFAASSSRELSLDEKAGRDLFQGSKGFQSGGPACIACHSVKNGNVAQGGLLAKDLTDVYSRLGEGIAAWLSAPSFPAMAASYQNHPLNENERAKLAAFLKYTDEVKSTEKNISDGYGTMLIAGTGGLVGILILISLLWMNRKRNMVKKDIFARQSKAWDAKH